MTRKLKLYINDMLDNMGFARELVTGIEYTAFRRDRRTHYAVIRCIEIIGEAAKHLPEEVKGKYPSVPWKEMAGMRDKIIHFYMGVDLEIV